MISSKNNSESLGQTVSDLVHIPVVNFVVPSFSGLLEHRSHIFSVYSDYGCPTVGCGQYNGVGVDVSPTLRMDEHSGPSLPLSYDDP